MIEPDPELPLKRFVPGRPTRYAGEANEQRWKAAIRAAFDGSAVRADGRVEVQLEFVLSLDQTGRNEPDLDNLIKSTVDALERVIGERSGTGSRVEADDVRVRRIVASKRHGRADEKPGATIAVSELPDASG